MADKWRLTGICETSEEIRRVSDFLNHVSRSNFQVGDRVKFMSDGELVVGKIVEQIEDTYTVYPEPKVVDGYEEHEDSYYDLKANQMIPA